MAEMVIEIDQLNHPGDATHGATGVSDPRYVRRV
jgi:hypothetical protein